MMCGKSFTEPDFGTIGIKVDSTPTIVKSAKFSMSRCHDHAYQGHCVAI